MAAGAGSTAVRCSLAKLKIVATRELLPTNLPTENGSYSPFQRLGFPRRERKSLKIRVSLDCHGRGREFESRRPRHSFFSAVTGASKETHVGYRAGFAMTALFTARNESRLDELAAVFAQDELLRFLLLVPVVERKAIREVYAGVHF